MSSQIQGLFMTMRLWDVLDILVVAFFLIPYLHPDPGYPSDSSSERAGISRAFYRAGGMAAAACSQLDPG